MKDKIINICRKRTTILWFIAFIFTIISFIDFTSIGSMDREVARLRSVIHKRQQILEEYTLKTLNSPENEFVTFEDFPQDMVIYRYFNDTLQSWVNQLPIANDDILLFHFGYRINHLNSRVVTNTPLAYLQLKEQYVNLGSGWYIVDVKIKNRQTVVSALLVQTEYPAENSALRNRINPNFSLRKQLSIVPVTFDESYIVHGREGGVLFSVLRTLPGKAASVGITFRWIAIILIIISLFLNLKEKKGIKEFFFIFMGLLIVRLLAIYQARELQGEIELFSPNLYADYGLFSSLGDLLINNIIIFLIVMALFVVRKSLARFIVKCTKVTKNILAIVFTLVPLALFPYVHLSLKSLIHNSNIVLELFKIDEIGVYTLLVYLSYGLIFLALLLSLQLIRPFLPNRVRISFLDRKPLILYLTAITFYTLVVVSVFGFEKEYNRNRVWTTRMSVERDLSTELQLRNMEKFIENDPVLALLVRYDMNHVAIENRLTEAYFWNLIQKYDIRITTCRSNTMLIADVSHQDAPPVHCVSFFENEKRSYGMRLGEGSSFYFMNNYNGRMSYLGEFMFYGFGDVIRLYIELDSRFLRESIGYPDLLLGHSRAESFNIPSGYSYAKYLNNRLVTYGGRYNYSLFYGAQQESGYKMEVIDGYVHFINKISDENIMIISRPERDFITYIVSFSYLMLFYIVIIAGLLRVRNRRFLFTMQRNSFRWKITVLIISSLVFALISLGAGSVWFSVRYFNETNRDQMEEKMSSVQSALSEHSKFAQRHNDQYFNNLKLLELMNRLSNTAQIDINIYGSDGFLLRTTRTEVFDRFLIGTRMNPEAFREIRFNNRKQFVNRESIGDLTYYSLYAPLFNIEGKLIAIANVPYFSRQSDFRKDATSIIAAIINIYLLLLIAAVFGGVALANSIAKPLANISKKMQILDLSQQPEHINYNNRDELGILVSAYNKMVDDLNESTRRLAQGEREQAWREMARQIAHEIKNPLTPMRLSIQHMMRLKEQGVKDWPKRFDALANSLIEQIDILSDAAGEFSSFSRFYSEELASFDLNSLVKEQIILFNTRDNIVLTFESNVSQAPVSARKTQLTRVFVNLISNAFQSVEPKESGRIDVVLNRGDKYYEVAVHDDGEGVPESLTHRLFKPNFTTKSGGTGLGLAICRSIMEQSQGSISYRRSERLGGACFVVYIPF